MEPTQVALALEALAELLRHADTLAEGELLGLGYLLELLAQEVEAARR